MSKTKSNFKVYRLHNISYDTDGQKVSLPKEAIVMVESDEDINETGADLISDNTGFCVFNFQVTEITDPTEYPEGIEVGKFYTKTK